MRRDARPGGSPVNRYAQYSIHVDEVRQTLGRDFNSVGAEEALTRCTILLIWRKSLTLRPRYLIRS